MNNARQAFEEHLKANRYDNSARLIFADWLEDHGLDDEAMYQRIFAARGKEADEWIEQFAKDLGTDPYADVDDSGDLSQEIDLDKILAVANSHLDERWSDSIDLSWNTPSSICEKREKFWEMFEIVTGRRLTDDQRQYSLPISCSC